MKNLVRLVAMAALSLVLFSGVGLTLSGCSADTLSGPGLEAYGDETGGGTGGGTGTTGSEHNNGGKVGDEAGGGTGTTGSEHNTGA